MRINKFVAQASGLSRRGADKAIAEHRVKLNNKPPQIGDSVVTDDIVTLDGKKLTIATEHTTIIFNKPVGYICSRNGQGSETIYDILPEEFHNLKPVGRLDKDSSGLLLLTDDGDLANQLTHPRYAKTKVYEILLETPLAPIHQQMINDIGVRLEDGPSKLTLSKIGDTGRSWQITMQEGRNRQIRRTFASLGYNVTHLHRTNFGNYNLGDLTAGNIQLT